VRKYIKIVRPTQFIFTMYLSHKSTYLIGTLKNSSVLLYYIPLHHCQELNGRASSQFYPCACLCCYFLVYVSFSVNHATHQPFTFCYHPMLLYNTILSQSHSFALLYHYAILMIHPPIHLTLFPLYLTYFSIQ